MGIKSFNKTHEAMAKSRNALLQVVCQVNENKAYYDSMSNELSRSFSECQTHWTKKTIEDQNDCSRYAGEILMWLSIQEASTKLNVSVDTIRRWEKKGLIKSASF